MPQQNHSVPRNPLPHSLIQNREDPLYTRIVVPKRNQREDQRRLSDPSTRSKNRGTHFFFASKDFRTVSKLDRVKEDLEDSPAATPQLLGGEAETIREGLGEEEEVGGGFWSRRTWWIRSCSDQHEIERQANLVRFKLRR